MSPAWLLLLGLWAAPALTTCPDEAAGIVTVIGSAPSSSVVLSGPPGDVHVRGGLTKEIERASGLLVRVEGAGRCEGPWPAIDVARYEVISLGGEPVLDGVLERHASGWAIRTQTAEVALRGVPDLLADAAGARVWVQASRSGTVQAWGALAGR